jgi:hypothetical protein
MVIGGILSFIVTLMIRGHALLHPNILEVATTAAGAWIVAVVLVWGVVRAMGKQSSVSLGHEPAHLGEGDIVDASTDSRRSRVLIGGGSLFVAGILIGAAFASRGDWSSTDTELVVVGGIALWQGIRILSSPPA